MDKRKICVVTGTRAEYGVLYWTMKALQAREGLQLQILATGTHLSPEFGLTYRQIEEDGFYIDKKVEIVLSSDTPVGISKSMGLALISISEALRDLAPDIVLVVGDRYEMLAVASACLVARIPIAHCAGGETTEGAIDESIRHSITKMSHIHFVATETYRKRVIQLGEDPRSVINVGALGIENVYKLRLLDREAVEGSLEFKLDARHLLLVTFHPVTLETETAERQCRNLLKALDELEGTKIVFTKANADTDGRIINRLVDEFVATRPSCKAFSSLGQLRYLSLLQYVDAVVGNSSSGLIEVPSFGKPTVNIGDRQKGRMRADSVIDCGTSREGISEAIALALSSSFKGRLRGIENPYDKGSPSETIVDTLESVDLLGILKKQFFDLNFHTQ